ncbi:MAG: ABATE domain-containing protein [Woeseia sp.]
MDALERKLENLGRVGGHPALDFVNTVDSWVDGEAGAEYLDSYGDLLHWHQMSDLIGTHSTRALSQAGSSAKAAALEAAKQFRIALQRLFHAVAGGRPLPQESLDHLNETIRKTIAWRRLMASGRDLVCGWDFSGAPPGAILGPVAWQAAELLEHGPLDRIKECPFDEGCGWLFLDSSRNRSRTWCSMKTCGNISKVKRFRARQERLPEADDCNDRQG